MKPSPGYFRTLKDRGGITFLAGVAIATSFFALASLDSLRGENTLVFLGYFSLAGGAYVLAAGRLRRDRISLRWIWFFALIYRLFGLTTTPTLSDDVYRYIWDGHLVNQAVNPYFEPVNSHLLDIYQTPLRTYVNHPEMASPYPPAAQIYFGLVERLAPQNPGAFQLAALLFDLATGWLLMACLKQVGSDRRFGLLYLWNPLVILEFSQGAHLDAVMLFWMAAGVYFWLRIRPEEKTTGKWVVLSALSLAAGALIKLLAALLAPLLIRRWGWRGLAIFAASLAAAFGLFAVKAGWGLVGPMDGRGVFGALRIYQRYWNYNGGIYHWLEVWISGYRTAGAVPVEILGEQKLIWLRASFSSLLGFLVFAAGWAAWQLDGQTAGRRRYRSLSVLRLAILPVGGYLLLSSTVHPWYATLPLPFLPFLLPVEGETNDYSRWIWPWIYFSIAVGFSYLTYLNPARLAEYDPIRLAEYLPVYLLLIWAALPVLRQKLNVEGNPST